MACQRSISKTVTLQPKTYVSETMFMYDPTKITVTCGSCSVYVMSFNDFSSFEKNLPYNFMTMYSNENVYGSFIVENVRVYQSTYFVVLNKNMQPVSVTYSLASTPVNPTAPPTPAGKTISIFVPVAVGVLVLVLIVSAIGIICVRRRLRKRREQEAYGSVGVHTQPYPVQPTPQPYVQPYPAQPTYMQQPPVQQVYDNQPQYYTPQPPYQDPYYQNNTAPSAPVYKI